MSESKQEDQEQEVQNEDIDVVGPQPIDVGLPFDIPASYASMYYEFADDQEEAELFVTQQAMQTIVDLYINNILEDKGLPEPVKDMYMELQEEVGDAGKMGFLQLFGDAANNRFMQSMQEDMKQNGDGEGGDE